MSLNNYQNILNEDIDWEPLLCQAEEEATAYIAFLHGRGIKIRCGIRISRIWLTNKRKASFESVKFNIKRKKTTENQNTAMSTGSLRKSIENLSLTSDEAVHQQVEVNNGPTRRSKRRAKSPIDNIPKQNKS